MIEVPARRAPTLLADPEVRVEGRVKVTGAARYAADRRMPGMLRARFLTSPVPHARIVSIDASEARAVPGVHAVLTGQDTGEIRFGRRLFDWPILAVDRVRFVGDRVAAVAAETLDAAEEALRLIDVEYEELEAILDPAAALAPDAAVLHPDAAGYFYLGGERPPVPHPNVQGYRLIHRDDDDLDAIFAGAARVFEHTFHTPPQHAGYLEPHATLVWVDDDGTVHVVSTNKTPFSLRTQMAHTFGLPPERIDVDCEYIGGDFGGKGFSVDEYGCYLLAQATGRPVHSVMSSMDDLTTVGPRHAAEVRLRTAVDAEGRFVAHHARVLLDGGAYAAGKGTPHLVPAGASHTLSAYRVPVVRLEVTTVYTNHAPAGHVRAPGLPQALFAGESHVDMMARELGYDPLEFRSLNVVRQGDVGITGERFREARAVEVLDSLRRVSRWGERPRGSGVGWGVAVGVRHVGTGKTSVRMRASADGSVEIVVGFPDQGAGASTVVRRVAAALLQISVETIAVHYASTADAPADPGVGGSKATHIEGRAVEAAVERLLDALWERAPKRLGEGARLDGAAIVTADGRRLGLGEAVSLLAPEGLEVEGAYDGTAGHGPDAPGDYDFAGHAIQVEVDRETGQVAIRRAILAADVGTVVNPEGHRGQLLGGFAFGLGAALMEGLVRQDGRVVGTTLGDVKFPTAPDVPPLEIVLLPTDVGPGVFGTKMAGELTNSHVAPAIANAVADAVGARVTSLPITAEKVLAALRDA